MCFLHCFQCVTKKPLAGKEVCFVIELLLIDQLNDFAKVPLLPFLVFLFGGTDRVVWVKEGRNEK